MFDVSNLIFNGRMRGSCNVFLCLFCNCKRFWYEDDIYLNYDRLMDVEVCLYVGRKKVKVALTR